MQPITKNKVIAGSVVTLVIIVLIAAISYYELHADDDTSSAQTSPATSQQSVSNSTSTTDSSSQSSTSTPTSSSSYADGTYTASSSYYVPHGVETIKVTLTVSGGVVTDSSIVNSEGDRESARYQEEFTSAYKSQVVGKSLGSIHLSYVAGASDTTQGFNDALDAIISQAKV